MKEENSDSSLCTIGPIPIRTTGKEKVTVSLNVTLEPSVLSSPTSTLPPPYSSPALASTASTSGKGESKRGGRVQERNMNLPVPVIDGNENEVRPGPKLYCSLKTADKDKKPEVEEEPHQRSRTPKKPTTKSVRGRDKSPSSWSTVSSQSQSSESSSGSPFRSKRRRRHDSDSEVGHLETYPFDADWRGHALIFDQTHFMGPNKKRKGSEKDCEALTSLFKDMKLSQNILYDRTKKEILGKIEEYTKLEKQKQAQTLVLVFLSHGNECGIMTFDKSQQIDIDLDVLPLLYSTKAPLLANKPKLIFQQACRGGTLDSGFSLDELDCPCTITAATEIIPTIQDCFVFYSCAKYFKSVRNPDTGSWFIQELVKMIRKLSYHPTEGELERIAKRVIHQITNMVGSVEDKETGQIHRAKCTPEYRNLGFKKDMYFGDLRVPGGSSASEGRRERPNSLM